MKKWKKILLVLVIGALIASAFMPMNSTADLSTAPAITVNSFMLSGIMSVSGEYANETQSITVEVENTGNEYLTDIVVTCEIYSDVGLTTEEYSDTNGTTSLDPDEVMSFGFDSAWLPDVLNDGATPTSFWVNVTASGTGFQDVMKTDTYTATEVIIQNMTAIAWVSMDDYGTLGTIMTPYPYVNETQPFTKGYTYLNGINTVQFNIKNVGNIETDVIIDASYYADPVFPDPVETDNDQATVLALAAGTESGWTDFTTTWDLTGLFNGYLNLSIASGSSLPVMNTSHAFWVQDLEDVMPMYLTTDLIDKFGTTTFNTTATHDFSVDIVNNGNQIINTDFYARLNATEWSAGAFGAESDFGYQMIDGATTNLNPGDASMEVWAGIAPPGPGMYQFNVTAPGKDPATNFPNDYNATNNQTSILLTFEDTEGLSLVLTSPTDDSKWPVMNMDINATITNMGTRDFWDLGGGQVSLMIYDNNDTMADTDDDTLLWNPANVTIPGLEMTMDTWADWTWTGAVGGEEYLVVVNATAGTTTVGQSVTITFPHPNGTVSGMITPAQTGIEVKAWDGATEILMTTTEATGFYEMSLEAIMNAYNITVTAPYGYYDAYNNTVMVLDDERATPVNFDLVARPGGTVNGTITLIEVGTPASPAVDYTDIVVTIDGTPLSDNADADGNYSIMDIVPDTVNVTATMTGFTSAWNDSVDVVVGEVTENVNLTLVEDWGVTVDPAHEATDVLVDAVVTVTFEEEINITSVNLTNSFEVEDDTGTTVDGAITWATGNMSFTFTPDGDLDTDTEYSVWLSTAITNMTDVEVLHRDWESTFVTEFGIVNGTVSGWVLDAWNDDPIAGATVSVGPVSTVSDTDGTYSLNLVAGDVTVGASKALYVSGSADATVVAGEDTPEINLSLTPDVKIVVSVMVAGTSTDVTPTAKTMGVDVDTAISIEFEEAINETSLEVTLADGGSVSGSTAWNATTNIATFTPDAALAAETNYTITITDALINATADAMLPRDIDWMFMTGLGIVPTVTPTITPAHDAIDVAVNAAVTIAFDYEMDTNLTEAAITAAFGTGFTWSADGMTVTIAHDDFDTDTTYTVTVAATSAASVEGYDLLAATSTFTTVEGPKWTLTVGPMKDTEGNILAGASIVVTDENGDTVASGTTDSNGNFVTDLTTALAAGTYTVTATDDGKSVTKDFTVSGTESAYDFDMTDTPIDKKADDDGDDDDNMLAIILIIIVIIIIVILLALAMRPKKPAEEELEEEEAEEEEGMEEEEFECPECGAAVSSGETVCPECGAEFEEEEFECPECGAKLEAGAGVCPECGAEFEAEEEELEEGEEGEEELEDYEVEEEEFEEEEEDLGEEGEEEELEEEMEEEEEGLEGEEEELPEEEEELPEEEEEAPAEEEEEKPEE